MRTETPYYVGRGIRHWQATQMSWENPGSCYESMIWQKSTYFSDIDGRYIPPFKR
ncbi:hypothetical protein GCM10027286_28440 [Virgibacillus ainsalahensis]